jgi:hypothetical protein
MDNLERIIKKTLLSETTPLTNPKTQQVQVNPMGAAYAPVKTIGGAPLSDFSKEIQKFHATSTPSPGPSQVHNMAYRSTSPAMAPGGDYATMNKQTGINVFQFASAWKNQGAYNKLMSYGARPFLATKPTGVLFKDDPTASQVKFLPISELDIKTYILTDDPSPIAAFDNYQIGLQIAMYNNPEVPVGTFVYFYEDPNLMYFTYTLNTQWVHLDWKYEPPKKTGNNTMGDTIVLLRSGQIEGWLGNRGAGEVIFIDKGDTGFQDVMRSDWIASLRDKYEIETLFKSTEKNAVTKVNMFGREVNLTALTDRVQMAFDWIGILVPPIDLINAAWYMGRGRTFEALISIIALIPGVGDALAICFRWLFRVLSKGGKLTTELISRMFKTVPAATRLSADVVIGSVKHAKEFVFLCRRLKLISPATSQAMVREIDNVLKGFENFKSLSFRSSKKALSDPVTQRQISRRIGVTVAKSSEPVLKQTREKFNKLLSRTGKLVWDWLFTKSRNYWKNAYAVSVKQFKQVFVQEGSRLATKGGAGGADKLAILLVSFTDKSVTRSFVKRIADDLVKVLPADSTGKVFTFGGSQRTKAQIIDYITNQPARCLKIYYQKVGVQAYNKLIDDLIAKSVSIGDNINAMWYAFWTDPVRRFINENIKFARIRGLKGGTSSGSFWNDNVLRPLKNTVSDLFDAFKGFFNTQDFLKRLDIIYNELQEYYERHDYPAEYGKDLNQQSLIYYIFDETWKDVTGKYFTDSQFDIDASLQAVDASYATYVATKLDATKLGEIDSLSFQGYYYTDPGSIRYNMAFLEQNVNQKTMEYVGKPTSYNDKRTGNNFKLPGWPMWKVIKDTQTGLKEGTIWLLDPDTKRMYTNAYDPEKSGKLPAAYQEFYNKQKALSRLQSQKQIK